MFAEKEGDRERREERGPRRRVEGLMVVEGKGNERRGGGERKERVREREERKGDEERANRLSCILYCPQH